jgi:hypothetical protein
MPTVVQRDVVASAELNLMIRRNSEQLVLQRHVRFRGKANTSSQDIGQCSALFGQRIYHRCARRRQRCLLSLSVLWYPYEVCDIYLEHVA